MLPITEKDNRGIDEGGRKVAKKLMVVDDSETMRDLVKSLLSQFELEIIEAADGIEGLEKIAEHTDISLIICDVNMPNLDGIAMIERYKETVDAVDFLVKIPIIMLTTENTVDKIKRAKDAGIAGWIIKPPKKEQLEKLVEKFCK